jgi:hypothetical protein
MVNAIRRLLLLVCTTVPIAIAAPAARAADATSAPLLGPADLVAEVLARMRQTG